MKKKLLIFDSNFMGYRHKFGMATLSNDEQETHIIFNFMNDIVKLCSEFDTKHIIFAWDSKYNLRKNIMPTYKEKRHKDKFPEEEEIDKLAYQQFDLLKEEVLTNLGFNNIMHEHGFESDDTIANFVMNNSETYNIIVVGSDKDLYQLLDHCSLCKPIKKNGVNKWTLYSKEDFINEWGIEPFDWRDIKCLTGCTSDEVDGIPGVKEKTAIKFITGKMNPKTATYEKIDSLKDEMRKVNAPVVILPFEGTPNFEYKPDSITMRKFRNVCERFDFRSFIDGRVEEKWREIFLTLTPKN